MVVRTTLCAMGLLALLCIGVRGGSARLVLSDEGLSALDYYRGQAAALAERLYQAKLHEVALLVDAQSEGKQRLPIPIRTGGAASGELTSTPVRSGVADDSSTLIAVYRASSPFSAKLGEIGECSILWSASSCE
jgi:hypothetical protein